MKKTITLICAILLIVIQAHATTYTAVSSGNFTSTSTWQNGAVPPSVLPSNDEIIINSSVKLTLNTNLTLVYGAKLEIKNNAEISSSGQEYLSCSGYLTGYGDINIDSFYLENGTDLRGNISVEKITLGGPITTLQSLNVKKTMRLEDGSGEFRGCKVTFNNAPLTTIVFAGGQLDVDQHFNISQKFNAKYIWHDHDFSRSDEVNTGSGMTNIEINLTDRHRFLTCIPNLIVKGHLSITSGRFEFYKMTLDTGASIYTGADGVIDAISGRLKIKSKLKNIGTLETDTELGSLTMDAYHSDAVLHLNGKTYIDDRLELYNGKLKGGLTLGDSPGGNPYPEIIGGSENSYIIGGMYLQGTKKSQVTFPIGIEGHYTPVHIHGNSFHRLGISVNKKIPSVYNDTNSYNIADKYPCASLRWDIASTNSLILGKIDVVFEWDKTLEVNNLDHNDAIFAANSYQYPNQWFNIQKATIVASSTNPDKNTAKLTSAGSQTIIRLAIVNSGFVSVNELAQTSTTTTLYPNPATNTLNISYSGREKVNATIYDVMGRTLKVIDVVHGKNSIDVSNLSKGNYLIKIRGGGVNTTHKFIKQ